MASLAKILSVKIENYITSVVQKKLSDQKTVSLFSSPGIDAPPLKDDKMVIIENEQGTFYAIGSLMITAGAESGEMVIFSRNSSGEIQGKIHVKKDGKIQLNEGEDFAVAFNKLKIEFEKLANAFNSHTQTVTGGVAQPPTPVVVNIDNAKVSDVLLPTGGTS